MNVKKYDPDLVKRTSTAANVRHRRGGGICGDVIFEEGMR